MLDRGKWQPYSTTQTDPTTGLPVTKTVPFNSVTGEVGDAVNGTMTHPSNRGDLQDKELRNRSTIAAQKELQAMGGQPTNGESPEQYVNRRAQQIYSYSQGNGFNGGATSSNGSSSGAKLPAPPSGFQVIQ